MNWHGLDEWQQCARNRARLAAAFIIWLGRRFLRTPDKRSTKQPESTSIQQAASPTISHSASSTINFNPTISVGTHEPAAPPLTTFQAAQRQNAFSEEESKERRLIQLEKELYRLIEDVRLFHTSKPEECAAHIINGINNIKGFFTNFSELRPLNRDILMSFYSTEFPNELRAGAAVLLGQSPCCFEGTGRRYLNRE